MKFFISVFLMLSSIASSQSIDDILKGKHRSEKNKARDIYRNPKETLNFFGIKNDMTVVELSPGGGWYQEIIGPYLRKMENISALPMTQNQKMNALETDTLKRGIS